jgi:hypothetical protein
VSVTPITKEAQRAELHKTIWRIANDRDAELLAFEPGCQDYCEREVDDYLEPDGSLPPCQAGASDGA